jgi:hypothetical protein
VSQLSQAHWCLSLACSISQYVEPFTGLKKSWTSPITIFSMSVELGMTWQSSAHFAGPHDSFPGLKASSWQLSFEPGVRVVVVVELVVVLLVVVVVVSVDVVVVDVVLEVVEKVRVVVDFVEVLEVRELVVVLVLVVVPVMEVEVLDVPVAVVEVVVFVVEVLDV